MNRLEIFQDRLTNGLKTIFCIRHTPATPPVVEAVAPVSLEKDPFLEAQVAALAKIAKDPELTEVKVDATTGLHRIANADEITVKI
ncbi:hypothetical protein A2363_02965 [Candidatus Gottesmanbacteria bacterium RIFOXYB1_FULL_47_11]|uniref:Uncharacterized protein n=1 Tax=Candidatus Gottesmanbacteria bacterium RIFOXYB1_FULL_47_11 TaxID=1798401 RepID=A0A1F6BCK3_9BACT|nr:MAG: hypothetical protein A2363_02965 [Candidatus Gottesmanbacteria bacterium RIFOXYB1_FULL_47_11]